MGIEKLFDVLLEFINLFRFWEVVHEFEQGIVLQFGKFRRVVGPGIRFILPMGIDCIIVDNITFKTSNMRSQTLTMRDKNTLVVSPVIAYRIHDIKKFLLEVESAEDALRDCTHGTVGEMVRHSTLDEMMTDEWHAKLYSKVREQGFQFGIEVLQVRLSDFGSLRTIRLINSNDYVEAVE